MTRAPMASAEIPPSNAESPQGGLPFHMTDEWFAGLTVGELRTLVLGSLKAGDSDIARRAVTEINRRAHA